MRILTQAISLPSLPRSSLYTVATYRSRSLRSSFFDFFTAYREPSRDERTLYTSAEIPDPSQLSVSRSSKGDPSSSYTKSTDHNQHVILCSRHLFKWLGVVTL